MSRPKIVKELTEPEYRALPNLSYSMLAGLSKDPANINNKIKLTSSLIYGSVVDCLLFDGKEEFDKRFAIMDHNPPTDQIKEIVDIVYEKHNNSKDSFFYNKNATLKSYPEEIVTAARQIGYGGSNWKNETISNKVIKEGGSKYWEFLIELGDDKIMVDSWMYERAINSVYTLTNHPFTKKYLVPEHDDIEIVFQLPIIWKYMQYDCRSLLDILYIDHKEKKIIPIDLKTTFGDVLEFESSYLKWNYYIQASFYTKSVSYLKLKYPHLLNYTIEPFRFMVISSNNTYKPIVWLTTIKDISIGEFGGYIKSDQNYVKGFKQLLEDYNWHVNQDKYRYPRDIYESNGHVSLDVF